MHDGLFTAHNDEPNWAIAQRILMPAFGPVGIQRMFPEMHEIATQLALKCKNLVHILNWGCLQEAFLLPGHLPVSRICSQRRLPFHINHHHRNIHIPWMC